MLMSSPHGRPLPSASNNMANEVHKGQWTPNEDEILRRCAQRRSANPTLCSASRCRFDCAEGACAHAHCNSDMCVHAQCTDRDCHNPNLVLRRPVPHGSLVMTPLDVTLCKHLTNTDKPWTEIANEVSQQTGPGKRRNAKQCRERWFQQLRPGLLHVPITEDECELILTLVTKHGNKWADISREPQLERRSDNWIKNWFNSSGNKKERAKSGVSRNHRHSLVSPQGIQRNRPQHQQTRSTHNVNLLYAHAVDSTQRCMPLRNTAYSPINHQQASYAYFNDAHHAYHSQLSSPATVVDRWDSSHYEAFGHPAQYHNRRRESTISVNTTSSMGLNGSGPSTPSTSVSLTFPSFSREQMATTPVALKTGINVYSTVSPRDPRMSIGTLCGAIN